MGRSNLNEIEIVQSFTGRRSRLWAIGGSAVLIVTGLTMALEAGNTLLPEFQHWAEQLTIARYVVMGSYVAFALISWRCPDCNRFLGRNFNPLHCRGCGAAFRMRLLEERPETGVAAGHLAESKASHQQLMRARIKILCFAALTVLSIGGYALGADEIQGTCFGYSILIWGPVVAIGSITGLVGVALSLRCPDCRGMMGPGIVHGRCNSCGVAFQ